MFESVTIGVVVLSIFVYGITLWAYFSFFRKETKRKGLFQKHHYTHNLD